MSHATDRRRALHWDGTVTAGNVLTCVAMALTLVTWGVRLEGKVDAERMERMRMEAEISRRMDADGQRERDGFAELRAGLRRIEDILLAERRPQRLGQQ
jgi:hypothetical protein